nr:leucine-rich repeat-containing protein 37A-like [Dasypus novemcinctus]
MEVAPSPTKQESQTQPLGLPKETEAQPPAFQEQTVLPTSKEQAQQSSLSSVTVQPLDLKLTVNPEPTTEIEHSTALEKTTAPPTHLQVTFPPSDEIQVQNPNLTTVTVKPVDLQLTIIPEHNTEVEPSPTKQESSTQPPESPQVVIPQLAIYHEVTVPPPGQNQSQHSNLPNVTVKSVDLEVTITSEPTSTTSSPELPQVAPPLLDLIQAQHPNLTEVTVKPGNLELTITPESNMEAQPPPTKQDQVQHSNPHLPSVTLKPKDLEVTITPKPIMEVEHSTSLPGVELPPPNQVQTLHPNPTIVQPLDIEHSITQHPRSSEADTVPPSTLYSSVHSTNYPPEQARTGLPVQQEQNFAANYLPKQARTGSPVQQEQTFAANYPPEQARTGLPVQQEQTVAANYPPDQAQMGLTVQKPQSPTPKKVYTGLIVQQGQNVTTTINICKLCTCKDETLDCSGLSLQQRLHRIPVLDPSTYNGTFTIFTC